MKNNSLIEYENIQKFADLYEQFLEENNLKDNDILKLFLVELRYEQLSYKITNNSNKMKIKRMEISTIKLSSCIQRWYRESNIAYYIPASATEDLDRSIQQKVKQNKLERERIWEYLKDIIVGQK